MISRPSVVNLLCALATLLLPFAPVHTASAAAPAPAAIERQAVGIRFEQQALDFGTLYCNESRRVRLQFRNVGSEPARVRRIDPG